MEPAELRTPIMLRHMTRIHANQILYLSIIATQIARTNAIKAYVTIQKTKSNSYDLYNANET